VPVRGNIASLKPDHFVVLFGQKYQALQVIDFPNRPYFADAGEFARQWDGDGLYVAASPEALARITGSQNGCAISASALAMCVLCICAGLYSWTPNHGVRNSS
jgi:hypothetical protein